MDVPPLSLVDYHDVPAIEAGEEEEYIFGGTGDHTGPVVYVIANGTSTYTGMTVNLRRRLRQHNGEISGGAASTRRRGAQPGGWAPVIIISGFRSTSHALRAEWMLKHTGGRGPDGRVAAICKHLRCTPRGRAWTRNTLPCSTTASDPDHIPICNGGHLVTAFRGDLPIDMIALRKHDIRLRVLPVADGGEYEPGPPPKGPPP